MKSQKKWDGQYILNAPVTDVSFLIADITLPKTISLLFFHLYNDVILYMLFLILDRLVKYQIVFDSREACRQGR
jgi:hypothetical protein